MIWVTRLDGTQVLLNDDQILMIEVAHDTIVSLSNGDRLRVQESAEQLVARVASWRRRIAPPALPGLDELEAPQPVIDPERT